MNYLILFFAIIAEVAATTALKWADGFTRPLPSVGVVIGYGIAFYLLSLTVRTIPTGIAYAIWSGVGIVLIAAVAWIVHDQKLDTPALIGIALILAGIMVITTLSETAGH